MESIAAPPALARALWLCTALWAGFTVPAHARRFTPETAADWAVHHSPALGAVRSRTAAVARSVTLARAGRRPSIRLGDDYALSNDPLQALTQKLETRSATAADFAPGALNDPGTTRLNTVALTATLPLYQGGRRRAQIRAARASAGAAQAELQQATQQTVARVLTAYATIEWATSEVQIARAALARDERHVRTTAKLRREGQIVASDHLTAVVAAARARMTLARARAALRTARAQFRLLLNLPPHSRLDLAPMPLPAVPAHTAPLIQQALQQRPELQALDAEVRAARAHIALAHASHRPSVALTAANDWYGNTPGLAHHSWTLMASISGALYDGGAGAARLARAHDEARALQRQRRAVAAAVAEQVEEAWRDLRLAQAQRTRARAAMREAAAAARLVQIRYGQGRTPLFDVLGSEQNLTAAQSAAAQATYDWRRAGIALKRARGLQP
ncbi:MAG TPA: TolC family protein [Acidiferrobacteraceae bacterium]|nr:TolC family protein [Acidiferrobacteraceae bacterium]